MAWMPLAEPHDTVYYTLISVLFAGDFELPEDVFYKIFVDFRGNPPIILGIINTHLYAQFFNDRRILTSINIVLQVI